MNSATLHLSYMYSDIVGNRIVQLSEPFIAAGDLGILVDAGDLAILVDQT